MSDASDSDRTLRPIGRVRSTLLRRGDAPKQGREGAPEAWLEIDAAFAEGLDGIHAGDELVLLTWLHQADRATLRVRPRNRPDMPIRGVFSTRSPDRPNPIGLHRVVVREIDGLRLRVGPLEAIDGTPVVDIKPVLDGVDDG